MLSYSERDGYEWSPDVEEALQFAVKCVGLKQANTMLPRPSPSAGADARDASDGHASCSGHQLVAQQPALAQACRAVVKACVHGLEREVLREIQTLGAAVSKLSARNSSGGGLPPDDGLLDACLTLLVTRPPRWTALMVTLSGLMGSFCSVLSEPDMAQPLQQLQAAVRLLADAWAQALSDVAFPLSGAPPPATQPLEKRWMARTMQYSDASRRHKAWCLMYQPPRLTGDKYEDVKRKASIAIPQARSGAMIAARPVSALPTQSQQSAFQSPYKGARNSSSSARSGWAARIGLGDAATTLSPTAIVEAGAVAAADAAPSVQQQQQGQVAVAGFTQLLLPPTALAAVLLGTAPERAHRLASSPMLLLLPAADLSSSPPTGGSMPSHAHHPAPAAPRSVVSVTPPELTPRTSGLGGGTAAAAAESVESASVQQQRKMVQYSNVPGDGAPVTGSDKLEKLAVVPGKPALPERGPSDPGLMPLEASATAVVTMAGPQQPKRLAPGGGAPRPASGRSRGAAAALPGVGADGGSSSSLVLLHLALFLSQARRRLAAHGVLVDLDMTPVLQQRPSGAAEAREHGDQQERRWQPRMLVSRPLVSPLLLHAGAELGASGSNGGGNVASGGTSSSAVMAAEGERGGGGAGRSGGGGAVGRPPPLEALSAAAASSGHELLRQVVASVAAVMEVTAAPPSSKASAPGPVGAQGAVSWPATSLLVLLAAGSPGGRSAVLQPCVLVEVMELVQAAVTASQALCCQVAQMPLLYPKDAHTDDACVAHSRGLALFERLHALMEACMALLRAQWQAGVLGRAAGVVPGAEPAAQQQQQQQRPLPVDRLGSANSTMSNDSAAARGASRTSAGAASPSPSAGSATGGTNDKLVRRNSAEVLMAASGASLTAAMHKIKGVFGRSGKVQPMGGGEGLSGRLSGGADENVGGSEDAGSSAAVAAVAPPLGAGRSRQRKLALQLSWHQLLVLERQRQVLLQLRAAVADVGKGLVDAFASGARDAYKAVDWAAVAGAKAGPLRGPTVGAEAVAKGLLAPLREVLLARTPPLHGQSRAFLLAGAVSGVLSAVEEQVDDAVKRSRLPPRAARSALGAQLACDLSLVKAELQRYTDANAKAGMAGESGGREGRGDGGGAAASGDGGMGATLESLSRQIATLEVAWQG